MTYAVLDFIGMVEMNLAGTISPSAVRKSMKLSMMPKAATKQLKMTLEQIRSE